MMIVNNNCSNTINQLKHKIINYCFENEDSFAHLYRKLSN